MKNSIKVIDAWVEKIRDRSGRLESCASRRLGERFMADESVSVITDRGGCRCSLAALTLLRVRLACDSLADHLSLQYSGVDL